ncbi:MAG: zinc-dependent alcohol dehydrogenase [Promethearchaeota archaeon]
MRGIYYDFKMWRVVFTRLFGAKNLMLKYRDDWPEPGVVHPTEVKVGTRLGGICGSDVHQIATRVTYYATILANPRNPFPIGHELVGDVVELGPRAGGGGEGLEVGDRVVYFPIATCEMYGFEPCPSCRGGEYGACLCLTGTGDGSGREELFGGRGGFGGFGGGGFSEYLVGFSGQFFKVPDTVPDEVAVLTEPLAVGVHAVARNPPGSGDTVLIVGAGTIGLMVLAAIRGLGYRARVVVLARYPFQAEAARNLGADEVVSERDREKLYDRVTELTGGKLYKPKMSRRVVYGCEGPDVIYDSVATQASLDDDLRLVRHGGKVVVVGQGYSVTDKVDWAIQVYKEVRVTGSLMYGMEPVPPGGEVKHSFDVAIGVLARDPSKFEGLVTHRFRVQEYAAALDVARHKGANGAIKVAFDFRSHRDGE